MNMINRTRTTIAAALTGLLLITGACASEADPETIDDIIESTTTEKPERTTTTTERETTTTTERVTTTTVDPVQIEMLNWSNDNVEIATDLSAQFTIIGNAAGASDLDTMAAECQQLTAMISDAQERSLPVPVAAIDRPWRAALDSYAKGAVQCVLGATLYDIDAITQATDFFTAGAGYLDEATAAISEYTATL
jgi:hypothetical protein